MKRIFKEGIVMSFIILLCLFISDCDIGKEKETGSSSRACSEAWKLYQLCKALNGEGYTRACDTQWGGVVYSCGMM